MDFLVVGITAREYWSALVAVFWTLYGMSCSIQSRTSMLIVNTLLGCPLASVVEGRCYCKGIEAGGRKWRRSRRSDFCRRTLF